MVGVAQLVERRSVAPNVAGSIPVSHPSFHTVLIVPRFASCTTGMPSRPCQMASDEPRSPTVTWKRARLRQAPFIKIRVGRTVPLKMRRYRPHLDTSLSTELFNSTRAARIRQECRQIIEFGKDGSYATGKGVLLGLQAIIRRQ